MRTQLAIYTLPHAKDLSKIKFFCITFLSCTYFRSIGHNFSMAIHAWILCYLGSYYCLLSSTGKCLNDAICFHSFLWWLYYVVWPLDNMSIRIIQCSICYIPICPFCMLEIMPQYFRYSFWALHATSLCFIGLGNGRFSRGLRGTTLFSVV